MCRLVSNFRPRYSHIAVALLLLLLRCYSLTCSLPSCCGERLLHVLFAKCGHCWDHHHHHETSHRPACTPTCSANGENDMAHLLRDHPTMCAAATTPVRHAWCCQRTLGAVPNEQHGKSRTHLDISTVQTYRGAWSGYASRGKHVGVDSQQGATMARGGQDQRASMP